MQEIKKEMYQKYADYAHSSCFVENHLGGCGIEGDTATHYPIMWSHLVSKFKIKSVLDVGCGFGYSLKFFEDLGCEVLWVEGSDKVIELTPLKDKILHVDYTASEFVPEKTYDLCWSCEFVEHVKEEFSPRFISTFKKSICEILLEYIKFSKVIQGRETLSHQSGHLGISILPS